MLRGSELSSPLEQRIASDGGSGRDERPPLTHLQRWPCSSRGGALLDRLRALRVGDLVGACSGCGQAGYCGRCTAVALIEHGNELGPTLESCRVAEAKERALGITGRRSPERVRLRVLG